MAPLLDGRRGLLTTVLLATLLGVVGYLAVGDVGLDLADEGFLWYGVQRVVAGEVPQRDFQAYDPGRYYWCAAWSSLFGDGILGVRKSFAIVQVLGLFAGLSAARRVITRPLPLVLVGLALLGWMFPRHKLFEPSIAMMCVYAALRLLESPTRRAYFGAGVLVGAAGLVGRNLALYSGLATFTIFLYQWLRLREVGPRVFASCIGGVVLGYAPLLAMLALVPGFAEGFWESLQITLRHGANLPRPWLWPWRMSWGGLGPFSLLTQAGVAFHYLLPVLVLPVGCVALLVGSRERAESRRLLIASCVVGAFFVHHAAVRSGIPHLAQAIHPTLLGLFALLAGMRSQPGVARTLAWGGCAVLIIATLVGISPLVSRMHPEAELEPLVALDVGGEQLRLTASEAEFLRSVTDVLEREVPAHASLFIAPAAPTLYAVERRRSPTWEIYFFWPNATRKAQRRLTRELEAQGVEYALVFDYALDNRRDLIFRNSNPLVWRYLTQHFEPIAIDDLPPGANLLRRKEQ